VEAFKVDLRRGSYTDPRAGRVLFRDLAPSTIGVVYSFLAGIFRAAVRDRLIVTSPCVGIRLPKPEPKRVEPLATE
jgi:hypothetical protein